MSDKQEFELTLDHLPLKKPSEVDKPELVILYGPAGGGKTHFAASSSEVENLYPILVIDTEGSAAGTLSGFDDDRVDILPVDNVADFDKLMTALTTKTHKYKTVVVDTMDVAQSWAVEAFIAENPTNTFAAWGNVKEWTVNWARTLKAAPFLGVMVFHEDRGKSETGAIHSELVLQGSAKAVLPGVPDIVALITRKANKEGEEVTTAIFAPDTKRATKNRFSLPAVMEDPSFQKIYEHIETRRKERETKKKGDTK